ncbi:hypothetical protein FA13DRAFT_1719855 [Coprinellus micaceus]|uniref:DUF4100 domain-containing protein n=1 Tax=Coprinellus micaceus TaxID=71717 RepID=A0A4Y7SAG8_COPMI|nr:hypothetical protein FA13DRAFT_1719855 [Coprinellus micaceus]
MADGVSQQPPNFGGSNPPHMFGIPSTQSTMQPSSSSQFPISSTFTTHTNQGAAQNAQGSHAQGVLHMPTRGSRYAPRTFRGNYRKVERFIRHYEKLLSQYNVTSQQEKCEALLGYCSDNVCDYIEGNHNFRSHNWNELKSDILKYYDADRTHTMFSPEDLVEFTYKASKRRLNNLAHWKKYCREYSIISGFLTKKHLISTRDDNGYFWHGIPLALRTLFENKLLASHPTHDNSQPWAMDQVSKVAEWHFNRDKFEKMFFHSSKLAKKESFDDSDDDSSSEDDSSDSDYDSDSVKSLKRRIKKITHKKKKKSKGKSRKDDKPDFPPLSTPVPPDRTSRYNGTTDDVENMIQRLNSMSINDPAYGHLYYKVLQLDTTRIAAQCIYREPQRISSAPSYQQPPLQNAMPPRGSYQAVNAPATQPPAPMMFPQENRCYGCNAADHMMSNCPKLAELIGKGIIVQDAATRKFTFPNGLRISRFRNESLYDAAMRQVGSPSSNFITYDSESSDDNASHQVTYTHWESDGSNTDTESDSDDGPYWKYAQHAKRELRYPTYASEYEPLSVYDAERVTRQTKEARHNATRVARKPTASSKPKQTLKPVVEILKRTTPAPVPAPDDVIMQPSKLQPPAPRPIDARRIRFPDDRDIEKLVSSRAQKFGLTADADKSQDLTKANKSHSQPRQSDLSSQVDTRNVVRQILDTEVSLPLRQILGTSKELSTSLQEVIKLKNRTSVTQPVAAVNNTQVNYSKSEFLIHLRVFHNDIPIFAIIDTGSMLNIVDGELADKIISLPIDTAHRPFMKDANGGHSQMRGVIRNADLACGSITTTADLHVSQSSPFNLLLGRPWQRQNFVSIDERVTGTYIVFKDPQTHEPRYEVKAIAVTPRNPVRDNYTEHLQANTCYFEEQPSGQIKECEPNCSSDSLTLNAESPFPFSAKISADDATSSDDEYPQHMEWNTKYFLPSMTMQVKASKQKASELESHLKFRRSSVSIQALSS